MTRVELVSKMAEGAGITRSAADRVLEVFVKCLKETVHSGDIVRLYGLGVFKMGKRGAKKGRNPKTGDAVDIPERKIPRFIPSKTWKNELNT